MFQVLVILLINLSVAKDDDKLERLRHFLLSLIFATHYVLKLPEASLPT